MRFSDKFFRMAAISAVIFALAACSDDDDDDDSTGSSLATTCSGVLCMDVAQTRYSNEPCNGAENENCDYANVFFTLKNDGSSVTDLTSTDVDLKINDREVGVEGYKALTSNNGLLVSLLLDKSYSITDSSSESNVKESAALFIDSLPDNARISVAMFASEDNVPTFYSTEGSLGTDEGRYNNKSAAKEVVNRYYSAYSNATSNSQTKIFDSVARWSGFSPTDQDLARLQRVMVVFTDGKDSASRNYKSAGEALTYVKVRAPSMKIYAIGLGDEVDSAALDTLSSNKTYLASSTADLDDVFEQVASDLSAIWQLKVLVSEIEYDARGEIDVDYDGTKLKARFELSPYAN